MKIELNKNPKKEKLEKLGVKDWPIWEKEESVFDWHYDERETAYIIEGEVEVETETGEVLTIEAGDLVVFPQGLDTVWRIKEEIKKHYQMG